MNATSRNLSTLLAFAGALPFWLLMIAPETVAGLNTAWVFACYGATIGSFLAGALWGHERNGSGNIAVIIASNCFALISFGTVVFTKSPIALVVQLILFGLILVADYRIYGGDVEKRWYWRLRLKVTLVVSLAYDVMLLDYVLNVCG